MSLICITEGVPTLDMLIVKKRVDELGATLVGPIVQIITPGSGKMGIMPASIHMPGSIGIIQGLNLTHEAVKQTIDLGLGQSSCVGIGGDPIPEFIYRHTEIISKWWSNWSNCYGAEIGGSAEEEAAEYIKDNVTKPVISYIAGQTAPAGKRMGHAGVIIAGGKGTAEDKIKTLKVCGVHIAENLVDIGSKVAEVSSARY